MGARRAPTRNGCALAVTGRYIGARAVASVRVSPSLRIVQMIVKLASYADTKTYIAGASGEKMRSECAIRVTMHRYCICES